MIPAAVQYGGRDHFSCAAALRIIFLHNLLPPLHDPKTGRPIFCIFLTKIRRFSVSFRRSPCLFFSKNECTEGGNSFLACHSFSVFMSSPATLQNMHQILPFGRAKCSFNARNPANSYFCKMALHFMHIFLAFCAGFPLKNSGFEIPLAFFACRTYIVFREANRLPILKRGAYYVSHHRCLRRGLFSWNGFHDR